MGGAAGRRLGAAAAEQRRGASRHRSGACRGRKASAKVGLSREPKRVQHGGLKRRRISSGLAAAALLASPAGAGQPVPPPPTCEGAAGERAALRAERARINEAIGDIALGRRARKRKVSGGDVAAGVAGTAASVLLPFGIGALVGAGARAAAKGSRKKAPARPRPDVPAMIERVNAIDARLARIEACG